MQSVCIRTLQISFRSGATKKICHCERKRGNLVETKRQTFSAPDKFFISSRLYKSFAFETLNRIPHLSGPCRYFFHHSYRVLSLQCYPSLAGKTGGTRIEKYRTLIMPLVRKCKEQHALAHLYNRQARRLSRRSPCERSLRISTFRL